MSSTGSSSPEPADIVPADSKKRKSQIEEIEVNLELPEPPSKKAKRLLKKGKPLPVKPNSDDEAEKDDGLDVPSAKDPKDKKSKRSEYGIWIGNLPFTLTRLELFKWLIDSSGGAIKEENITRVNLPASKLPPRPSRGAEEDGGDGDEKPKPQNKGFAYVDFDTQEAAVAAMSLTETALGNRNVLIKSSTSFEGRPQAQDGDTATAASGQANGAAATAAKNGSKKIYVGNLGFKTTEDDLREHFEKCGEIEWLKVATFEDSGKCKGFGWVKFKEAEAAESAVKGFVRIKEEIETEDDFKDSKDDDVEAEGAAEKKFKMRKWWVNRLYGRELKVEFAEDDQVRYKKRFGKDAPARKDSAQSKPAFKPRERTERKPDSSAKPAKTYGDAQQATYLTGAVVQSQGKKVTFD